MAGLVVLGATAGIDDPRPAPMRRRRAARPPDRGGRRRTFLDGWLAQPLFARLEPTPDDLAARRANSAEALASSLRLAGTGTMDPPWWDELAAIDVPTRVLWGGRDAKFAALGDRLVEAIGTGDESDRAGLRPRRPPRAARPRGRRDRYGRIDSPMVKSRPNSGWTFPVSPSTSMGAGPPPRQHLHHGHPGEEHGRQRRGP
ncbi:MAG: hypothetical protein R2711_15095 [Acidimicrobiales bacterium]